MYQLKLLIKVKTDLSDFVLGVCLIQKYKDKVWHLVAYYSRKLIPQELSYNIYNKELLTVVVVLKKWRTFLQRIIEPFIVKTDYKNLTRFLIIKELNQKQVKWAEMLIKYYFEIEHIKGIDNIKADALSRKAKL